MRQVSWAVLGCSMVLSGCGFLGYYKYEKPVWATPQEASRVNFPNSFEEGVSLQGPMMAALNVAMKEFRPPGFKVRTDDGDKRLADCLSRWETFDTSVLQVNDNLFFVRFFPDISRCGIQDMILDAGAVYAVDGQGRILDMH